MGHGDIAVAGLQAGANLQAGNGNVAVAYALVPKSGSLEIKTGRGDVTLLQRQVRGDGLCTVMRDKQCGCK